MTRGAKDRAPEKQTIKGPEYREPGKEPWEEMVEEIGGQTK